MPIDDLRADLSAAFDAVEKAETSEPTPPTDTSAAPEPVEASPEAPPSLEAAPEGETAEQKAERARDEAGRFAKKQEVARPAAPAAKPQEQTPVSEGVKPPQSWKPALREKFSALPPEVQQEVVRRERDIAQTLSETAEARQGYQRFRETLAPFEHMLRAEGADPYRTISSFMQTAMALSSGAQGTKAQTMAALIKHYGVDVGSLADALEGQPMAQQSAAQQGQYRDPRVDQLLAQVEHAKAQRFQQMESEAQKMIGEIQGEEFFSDVRDAMADILEVAAKRGVAMTPREAYNRAVWADPHVAEVLQQRQAARQAATRTGATSRAVAAASSVRGSPAVGNGPTQPNTLRGDIEAALDRLRDG